MILEKDIIINTLKEVENDEIEISESDDTHIAFYDYNAEGYRYFYFNETLTIDSLKDRIYISPSLLKLINKENLLNFIFNEIDRNALMTVDKICFMYEESDYEWLFNLTGDEYSLCIQEDELLGLTWVERSIVIIDVKNLINSSKEIEEADISDGYISHFFEDVYKGFLSTIFHELRHLIYECNSLIELGDEYPFEGGLEENVEEYGNFMTESLSKFYDIFNKEELV